MSNQGIEERMSAKLAMVDVGQFCGRRQMSFSGKKFHFIGAGGIGTSGLAKLLMKHAAIVSGSDMSESSVVDMLRQGGADIKIGHKADNLAGNIDAVVISAAVKDDNPELVAAKRQGCRVYKYAQMLGEVMRYYSGIAVSGTHGKSTTSAWLSYVLTHAGLEPSFIVGADIPQLGGSSGAGNIGTKNMGETPMPQLFVAEACEYDRSFLSLHPKVAVILNVEADHLDYYKDEAEIVEAFCDFANGTVSGGTVVVNGEDANVAKVIASLPDGQAYVTFGLDKKCTFRAEAIEKANGCYAFDVWQGQKRLGRTHISVPGMHNVYNGLAVIAAAVSGGADANKILKALPGFTGVDRRIMLKGMAGGITVLDDYAHHPTEIRASLKAIRERFSPKRLWCIFQPHQYSRTRFLLADFAESFKLADITIVPDIYFVRDTEQNKKEVNAQVLVNKINSNGSRALFIATMQGICEHLKQHAAAGDVVVTMGAGDIWKVADEYIQWLGKHS
jgi:UDP-N-acetylmuramate--alanine ligase